MGIVVRKAFFKGVLVGGVIFLGIITIITFIALSISTVKINAENQAKHDNAFIIETEEKTPEIVAAPGLYSDIAKMRANAGICFDSVSKQSEDT